MEFGPVFVFVGAYWLSDLMTATVVLMATTIGVTAISVHRERRVPIVPAASIVILLVTGGLTLGLDEPRFIKMRMTIVNGLYGAMLLASLAVGRPLLEQVLRGTIHLSDRGWRGLTWRVGVFLLALAVLNEIVWRNFSTDVWVAYKLFGVLPLDVLFGLSLWPYANRHRLRPVEA
jgi:intracellular septation protein